MPVNSIVIAREVWDTRDLIGNIVEGESLKESALGTRFEPEDMNSLEQALQIKEKHGGTVTVISAGKPGDVDVLRESLFRGVDEVIRISLPDGLNADTALKADLFAAAIRKLGDARLILTGVGTPEGENSQLGAELAARLGYDQVSYVDSIDEFSDEGALCKRELEMGSESVRVRFPAVLMLGVYLLKDDPRTPRSAKAMLKLKMKKVPIREWDLTELDINADTSLKIQVHSFAPVESRQIETVEVDPENGAALKSMLQNIL
jgi:electron transfer flavoprotein beta subunit